MNEDDELLAAELALGLIDGDELEAAERRRATEPAFSKVTAWWQRHAASMVAAEGVTPRPSLWREIEMRLPANDVSPARLVSARPWQYATLAASVAALLLAGVALDRRPAATPPVPETRVAVPLIAMLTSTDSKAVVAVSFDPAHRQLTLSPAALDPGAHSAELWVIPADKRPRSLGVVDPTGNWRQAPAAASVAILPGATLAVSIEPVGGSPTGQPTGPVVLSGTVHAI